MEEIAADDVDAPGVGREDVEAVADLGAVADAQGEGRGGGGPGRGGGGGGGDDEAGFFEAVVGEGLVVGGEVGDGEAGLVFEELELV